MAAGEHADNVYWADVDPDAPNNAHAFSLELVGRNKRVLELGPAAGAFTRALVAQGCQVVAIEVDPAAARMVEPVAERVIVGSVADPAVLASAIDDERFDVVVAGDVLEHLADPLSALKAARGALRPGGYVVLSLPNVAHADVKLQLLAGRFAYQDTGLLDRTHLHFFTLESVEEMVRDAGLLMIDLRRVVVPVFRTEQAIDPASVDPAVLANATADPESETYQFVVRALIHDGAAETERLAARVVELETGRDRERLLRSRAQEERAETAEEAARLRSLLEEAQTHARGFEELSSAHERHIAALTSTRSYRMLQPLRSLFARRR